MIVFPAEYQPRKEALFAALAEVAGGGLRLKAIPSRLRGYPETAARADAAMARAKRQHRGLLRWLKRRLIAGQYNWARSYFTRHPDRVAVAWNGLTGSRMAYMMGARDAGAARLYAELAPLPGRITLDPVGVNAESSVPGEPDFFHTYAAQHGLSDWRRLGAGMVARPSRRSDVGQGGAALPDTPFLFCPLQVPDDSQITLFSGWCGGMEGFFAALTQAVQNLPDGWHLRLKEHPSAKTSLRPLLAPLLATGRAVLDNDTDSFAQVAASRGVVTLNSSMGLQAFFHDKPVVTLGRAFWALPGLVTPATSAESLAAILAQPQALGFDQILRDAFMSWLDRVYYPVFDPETGFDRDAFAAKLAQARAAAAAGP